MEGSQGRRRRAAPNIRGRLHSGRRAGATGVGRRTMGGKVSDDRRRLAWETVAPFLVFPPDQYAGRVREGDLRLESRHETGCYPVRRSLYCCAWITTFKTPRPQKSGRALTERPTGLIRPKPCDGSTATRIGSVPRRTCRVEKGSHFECSYGFHISARTERI